MILDSAMPLHLLQVSQGMPTFIPLAATAVLPLFGTHLFCFDDVSVPGPVNVYLQRGDLSQNIVTARNNCSAFAQPQPAIQVQFRSAVAARQIDSPVSRRRVSYLIPRILFRSVGNFVGK